MTRLIRTDDLLDRLPAPRRSTSALISTAFLGKKEVPPEITAERAIALAAFAQARTRGVPKAARVYHLVATAPGRLDEMLVVVRRGGPVQLVPADGFEPTSAVVIELDELRKLVESDAPIPG